MCQTLFYFPERIAGVPLFGLGWALAVITLIGLIVTWKTARVVGWQRSLAHWLPTWAIVVVLIGFVLPAIERMPAVVPGDELANRGVPVRGYGVMLFLACGSALGLAVHRAPKRGISTDAIFRLATSFFILGIVGARATFLAQHWDRYAIHSAWDFFREFVNIAEGGLVVYGSLVGAAVAFVLFVWCWKVPFWRLADVIAPCLLLGLAIGRIGCFLNGCCWGGISDLPWSVRFPAQSPPYVDQAAKGWMWGFECVEQHGRWIVNRVLPGSPADLAGVQVGDALTRVGPVDLKLALRHSNRALATVQEALLTSASPLSIVTEDGRTLSLQRAGLPERSWPVHPTQLYESLSALLLMGILLAFDRSSRREGAVTALCFTLYPITRFLMEMIRDDEPGAWGTSWTFSQWFSVALFILAMALWFSIWRSSAGNRDGAETNPRDRQRQAQKGTYSAKSPLKR